MDFSLYFDEPQIAGQRFPFVEKAEALQNNVQWASRGLTGALSDIPVMLVGFQEGEQSVADAIRVELYALANVVVKILDVGNLKLFTNLEGRKYALEELLQWAAVNQITPLFLNVPSELEYTIAKFYFDGKVSHYVALDSTFPFRFEEHEFVHNRCLEKLLAQEGNPLGYHYVQLGHQDYLTSVETQQQLSEKVGELVRLGAVRQRLQEMEPYFRHADILSVDANVLKYSECPAQQEIMPNGLYGQEFCQLLHYGGHSINLKSVMLRGLQFGECDRLSARQLAQSIWLLMQAFGARIWETPTIHDPLFKRFTVTIENSPHSLHFYKSDRTNRWWFEFPANNKEHPSTFIACTYNDYLQASENQIPERWLQWFERLSAK